MLALTYRVMWTCFYDLARVSNVPDYCLYYFRSLRWDYYCFLMSPDIEYCAIASKSFIYQDTHYFLAFGFVCVCVYKCLHANVIHTSGSLSLLAADILSLLGRNMHMSFKSQSSLCCTMLCVEYLLTNSYSLWINLA